MNGPNEQNRRDQPSKMFSFFFIKPLFGSLLAISLVLAGIMGYTSMVKEALPDLEVAQAQVITEWPGASPEQVEKEITNKIEKKIKSLKGLKRFQSGSRNSFSIVAVEFQADSPLQESLTLLRAKVDEAKLPSGAEKPKIEEVSITDTPIITFMLYGDIDEGMLGQTARRLRKRFERIPGIKKVSMAGARDEVLRVQFLPERIKSVGVSPTMLKEKIKQANLDMPLGKFESEKFVATLNFAGRFADEQALRNLPIKRLPQGRVVRLGELAIVTRDLNQEKSRTFLSWKNGEYRQGVSLALLKSSGKDTLKLVKEAKAVATKAAQAPDWPQGLDYAVVSDNSVVVWEKLNAVISNGWQAMLAVFLILFVFLTWREALIAGLSIPLTFLGVLAILQAMGYTMNEMIVIGMVLALGLLVDVFILAMEGMHEGIFVDGRSFDEAAAKTVRTFALPAFAGQATTILAMAPMFAIGGTDGKFIRLIPVTAIACLLLSYVVAFAVDVPLSRSLLGKGQGGDRKTRVDKITEVLSGKLSNWLQQGPLKRKRNALLWFCATIAVFVLSVMGAGMLPSLLYPKSDGRNLAVTVELSPDSELADAQKVADALGLVLREKPYFQSVTKFVGKKSPFAVNSISESLGVVQAPNLVGFSCFFIPKDEREKLAFEYLGELRGELEAALRMAPGAHLLLTPELGGSTSDDPVQIIVEGEDVDTLKQIANQIKDVMQETPGATDVRDTLGAPQADVKFTPKREVLDFYGLSEGDTAAQVRLLMTHDKVGKYKMPGTEDDLDIRLGAYWESRGGELGGARTLEEVAQLTAITPQGRSVPLLAALNYEIDSRSQVITHMNGARSVVVKAKTRGRTTGQILAAATPALDKLRESWPRGYDYRFGGEAESSAETYANVQTVFGLALFLVFAVLAMLFNSYKQPLIIMFTVLFAMIGTLGGFFLAWIPFSFPAMIGIISLVGIVVNDAIVMIETMNKHRARGLSLAESAARGAGDRLRPIISTTLTTTAGLFPLALSDPMWMPLCMAIVFGLSVATGIALVIVPCLYVLLTGERGRSTEAAAA